VIGNPFETALALHYLIFDGVLERHPNLKILAVHGAGYLGAYSGRMDYVWGARSDCRGDLPHPPTHYLKKIYVDSVVFTAHQLAALIETCGADHVLIGTNYPFRHCRIQLLPQSQAATPSDCLGSERGKLWAVMTIEEST
jgi:aminocarboxymuconate-semialdehyde decarboxylase